MSNLGQTASKSLKRTRILGRLGVAAIILAGFWLLDRFVAERSIQLLILSWVIAAMACGLAMRSARAERDWWALPAWMLAGSAFCLLTGLLTLQS